MKAEILFREAFYRLLNNGPQVLPKGAHISQNNVAREAGCDPTALRKSRYPELVAEIKSWIETNSTQEPSNRQRLLKQRSKKRTLNERLTDTKVTMDVALSMLVEADAKILELTMELEQLKSQLPKQKIISFPSK